MHISSKITGIHIEPIRLKEPFIDFAARFASSPGTVILMSGGNLDCARYHVLGVKPWLIFSGRNNDMKIKIEDQAFQFEADPFVTLRKIVDTFRLTPMDLTVPIAAGLMGYLSYDLKDYLEELPRTSVDDLGLPHICFYAASIIVVHDKTDDTTQLCYPIRSVSGQSNLEKDLAAFKEILATKSPLSRHYSGDAGGFQSNFTRATYMSAIEKIKEYIASGHVYQVNLAQRFEMNFKGDPFALFKTLYHLNPAPFFSYIHAGNHFIISTSPERFILQSGNKVETRPIKGTRPRGKTPEKDKRLRTELLQSRKDDAELSMIVDLLRNDIGKVCKKGSVRVVEHKRLEAYQNVYHLVSIVEGLLDEGRDSVDLIKATFPGGSITGCPKIRAMEVIDELEPNRRHIYTGSIGYISFHNTMDLSIAIRTATLYNEKIFFSVGGGIVFDSEPIDEFDETLHKGQTLIKAFQGKEAGPNRYVWFNGSIQPIDQARISATDQGFQYEYGFFETIRINYGKPKHLKAHIDRFNRTWKHLFTTEPPDLTWKEIINQVITDNGLTETIAALKIIAAWGDRDTPPFRHTFLVMARPYTHRLTEKKEPGLNLSTYPEPRQTPLADHKTLNYLYYHLAGKWAKAQGSDEALILNPEGTVSETNTANILLIKDKSVINPLSSHVLPGIMANRIYRLFSKWGYAIENKPVSPEDLFWVDQVMITNSLMGAVPILRLDGGKLPKPDDLWRRINNAVLF